MKNLIPALFAFPLFANGTIQVSPTIHIDNELKLTREPSRVLTDAMVKRVSDFAQVHHPQSHWCSANWNGYTLQWRLDGNLLLLETITYDWCSRQPATYKAGSFFNPGPGSTSQSMAYTGESEPLFADWVSDVFTVNTGEKIQSFHVPPLYSHLKEFHFEYGRLVNTIIIQNPMVE